REGRTGQVEIWSVLGTRTSVMFDLDEDGDLDIVTGDFGSRPQVLISDLAQKRDIKYLKVELVGTKSNRDGLGALVKVVAGGREYVKMNDGKSGYLTQSSLPIYFGLGEAKSVDRVEVKWPSGRTQTLTENLPINDLLVIEEAGD
ncbi:MAG: ASPIC/UnbV domain-containing protein, partial [Thermoanaerobaculia bacterium]